MSRLGKTIQVACDPEIFGRSEVPMTLPRLPIALRKAPIPILPWSIGKEVDEALAIWYGPKGVPADEIGIGAKIDAANAAEEATFLAAVEKAEEELPSVVPPFGTPEFWAYHRKKKELENKRRAEAGLPPLPTKQEIEAAKKAKADAKAKAKVKE